MARDSSGTYTRPSNSFSNPVTGQTIDPTDAAALFDDIETELTDSLSRSNKGAMLAALDMNGQELILDADADTSITADTDDQIDIKVAGADDFQITANTLTALSGSAIATDTINETTSATGVTVDGVLLKDGLVDGRDVATDGSKLDGIEALADVTDATNVAAAGALMASSNLSDVGTAATARTNLGVAIGSDVQAHDAVLDDIAGLTLAQGDILYFDGANVVNLGPGTSGYFLKTQGAAANPVWANIPGGGDLLSTNNLSDVGNTATAFGNIKQAASDSATGVVELAIASEVNTGTDTARAVTPDALAGSNFGIAYIQIVATNYTTSCSTGDGKAYFHIPPALNGMNLVYVHGRNITAGTTGTMDIQIANVTDTVDMLSTKITIDSTETGSDTAATPAVINTANDDVATNDLLRIDFDAVHTTPAKGAIITLGFQLP